MEKETKMRTNRHPAIAILALALVIAAVAAPVASARPIVNPPQRTPATQIATLPTQATGAQSNGFDWGDAGIGAGAVALLVLGSFAARLTVAHRRRPHSGGARSTISAA
jgi:hypothetical protein